MQSYNYPSSQWSNSSEPNGSYAGNRIDSSRRHSATVATLSNSFRPSNLPPLHHEDLISQYSPPAIHTPDLFFANRTPQSASHDLGNALSSPPALPPRPHLHYAYSLPPPMPHSPPLSSEGPYFHRSVTSPPIPPKPSPTLHRPAAPKLPPKVPLSPPRSTAYLPPLEDDGDALAAVLALSKSEPDRHGDSEKLSSQEEEDLARALEESMISAGNPYVSASLQGIPEASSVQPRSSENAVVSASTPSFSTSASSVTGIADARRNDSWQTPLISTSQMSEDEAFARRLAAEEANEQQSLAASRSSSQGPGTQGESSASANGSDDLPQHSLRKKSTQHNGSMPPVASDNAVLISDDEAYARQLAAEEREQLRHALPKTGHVHAESSVLPVEPSETPPYSTRNVPSHEDNGRISDKARARRLAPEDTSSTDETKRHVSNSSSSSTSLPQLSLHEEAASNSATLSSMPSSAQTAAASTAITRLPDEPALLRPDSSRSSSNVGPSDAQTFPAYPSPSASVSTNSMTSLPTSSDSPHSPPDNAHLKLANNLRTSASVSSVSLSTPVERLNEPLSPSGASLNHFIDADLLLGVSLGFMAPPISTRLTQMHGKLPNIISLPYGRCPPLHLQAPSWRHLLKLMARLSGTRVEPTVEALALTKSPLQLRTVVQFVKPHHASPDWRTVLWFTIDHPVPASMPGAHKFTNGDVNVLPWSYTLSNLPNLLRDGADSPMSKTYTIPATELTPYPLLPISFPNLAMYLQAALEESRRYAYDSSSGIRKLAKIIDVCYPFAGDDDALDAAERNGKGGLFKRVMGRGNKSNKKPRGGNEDTYELVTPFVSEEWG